jgi:hypothetical protein
MYKQPVWVCVALLCGGLGLLLISRAAAAAPAEYLYGVTLNDVSDVPSIVGSLKGLARRPTARIVFQAGESASRYVDPVREIHSVSDVMGEIVDSSAVLSTPVDAYLVRTQEYVAALGDTVDIWEIGNEVNGEWLGDATSVVAKIAGAYDLAAGAGKRTALTLYYNDGCYEKAPNEMFTWATTNVPERMRQGLSYVLISYYEDDCEDLQPEWSSVFPRLAELFPNSKVGFGEAGAKQADRKAEYMQRYYGLRVAHPAYIGGVFWWYFREDCVPASRPLWKVLNDALQP